VYVVAAVVVMAMSAPVDHTQVPVPVCSWKYRAISMHNACRLPVTAAGSYRTT